MGEIHGRSEVLETKKPEVENFKHVSPELKEKFEDAKAFVNKLFYEGRGIERNEIGSESNLLQDDNGKIYGIGDELSPNCNFEKNGYEYQTDKLGRVVSAEGKLKMRDPEFKRDMASMESVGKGDQKEGDQRGHLIAYQFGGSGGIENLVPMEGKDLNQRDYKNMENMLADAVKGGADVYLKVEPKYKGDSVRPTEFRATYTIDGERDTIVFKNRSDS